VGPYGIIFLPPTLNENLRLLEGAKNLSVEQFITQFTPQFFSRWPIPTPGCGMSIWPRLFLWRTITGWCWPGVLKLALCPFNVFKKMKRELAEKMMAASNSIMECV
jgi:hypothetical protein